jgi:small subunit ribosomal protein S7
MALKFKSTERFLKPDPRYGSRLVGKLINNVMKKGKKATAQRIVYRAMDIVKEKVQEKDPLEVVTTALNHLKPVVEVRSRRVGGANYQVPIEVSRKRQQSLAIRWLLEASRAKKGKPMAQGLAAELVDASNKTGAAYQTRENVHRMADANKAFAHFGWRR